MLNICIIHSFIGTAISGFTELNRFWFCSGQIQIWFWFIAALLMVQFKVESSFGSGLNYLNKGLALKYFNFGPGLDRLYFWSDPGWVLT